MPIVYETPGPVAAMGDVGLRQAQLDAQRSRALAAAASHGSGDGGGGGGGRQYGGAVPYDTGIQDAIQFRDTMQFQQAKATQDNARAYGLQAMEGDQRITQQNNQAVLQAQLHEVELSQQERMRLQRLKNAVGEVSNDPTLTDEQKSDYLQQIKYNVHPLQDRLAKEKLSQDKMVKEQLAEKHQWQAAAEKSRLDILGRSAADRTSWIPDNVILSNIVADITKNVGPQLELVMGSQAAKKTIADMAEQQALLQGLGTHAYLQPDGKLVPIKGDTNGDGKPDNGSTGGGKPGADHPTGLSPTDYMKAVGEATAQAHKEASLSKTGEGSIKTSARPELQDAVTFNKRVGDIMQDVYGLPRNFNDYNAQKPTGQTKDYKSPFAKPAAAAATPPSSQAKDNKTFAVEQISQKAAEVEHMTGISDDEKFAVKTLLKKSQDILSAHPVKKDRPKEVEAELLSIAQNYDKIMSKAKPAEMRPAAPSPPPETPWWRKASDFFGGGDATAPGN